MNDTKDVKKIKRAKKRISSLEKMIVKINTKIKHLKVTIKQIKLPSSKVLNDNPNTCKNIKRRLKKLTIKRKMLRETASEKSDFEDIKILRTRFHKLKIKNRRCIHSG